MTRIFLISGYAPAQGQDVNRLLQACDIGIEGAYIPFRDRATVAVRDDATEGQRAAQSDAIRMAYAAQGCVQITIEECD